MSMQPPPGPPPSSILLTIQGSVMTSNMIVPTVLFNGYRVPVKYGQQVIPVSPGPLQIEMYAQWLRRYGQASLRLDVQPGQQIPVFYATPYHQFTTGSIGHQPQKRKGGLATVGIVLAIILVVVIPFVLLGLLAG